MSIAPLMGLAGKVKTLLDRLTSTRATNLDNLDATVSSRAPSSTALSTATWTGTKAGYLDQAITGKKAKVQVFTASGTWTRPATTDAVYALLVGGGQGGQGGRAGAPGGGFDYGFFAGGGGGGGEVVERWVAVTGNITVTVGLGGAGGVGSGVAVDTSAVVDGSNGGDTTLTVGAVLTARGGGTGGNGGGAGSAGTSGLTTNSVYGGGGAGAAKYPWRVPSALAATSTPETTDSTKYGNGGYAGAIAGHQQLRMGGKGVNNLGGGGNGAARTNGVSGWILEGVDGGGQGESFNSNQGSVTGGNGVDGTGGGGGGSAAHASFSSELTINGGDGGDGLVVLTWWE